MKELRKEIAAALRSSLSTKSNSQQDIESLNTLADDLCMQLQNMSGKATEAERVT